VRRCLALVLVAGTGGLTLVATGCGGGEDDAQTGDEAAIVETTEGTTAETGTATTNTGEGDAQAGEQIFATAGCGNCHTLAAAGATGQIGPNLDELQPGFDQVVEQVTNGGGGMPSFGDTLSDEQIRNVAAFVVQTTTSGGTATVDGATTNGATTDGTTTNGATTENEVETEDADDDSSGPGNNDDSGSG
jgi:mono/diheme cytochrome c family protein